MARAVKPSGKRVVLVWNEHPTEVVAGFHARKVARILRERYGHNVVMKKIPTRETNYGIVKQARDRLTSAKAARRLASLRNSFERARIASRRYGAPSFSFHVSNYRVFKGAEQKTPRVFRVGLYPAKKVVDYFDTYPSEIVIEHEGIDSGCHVVEIPSVIVPLPKRTLARRKKALALVIESALNIKKQSSRLAAVDQLKGDYQVQYAPLNEPENKRIFMHQAISKKIAAAIHARLMGGK